MTPPRRQPETGPLRKIWAQWNLLLQYVESLRPRPAPGYQLRWTAKGWSVVPRSKASEEAEETAATVGAYRVKSAAYPDSLLCKSWDGTNDGETFIHIMKPWQLRRTPWDAKTITYATEFPTANINIRYTYQSDTFRRAVRQTGGLSSENQQIIPLYQPDNVIFAISTAGTGDQYPLLDLNVDGRAWARV